MRRQKTAHVDDPVAVGARLRAARTRAKLTLRELSFAGCSPTYLSHLERGERTASLQVLVALADRLSVPVEWLARGTRARAAEYASGKAADHVGFVIDTYEHALSQATTHEAQVWALAGLGQAAALRGDRPGAISALKQALALLRGQEHADIAPMPDSGASEPRHASLSWRLEVGR